MGARPLEFFLVGEHATIKDAIAQIQKNESRCVLVVDRSRKMVGAFSEGDVLRAILEGTDVHTPLSKVIKPSFQYLQRRDLSRARALLLKGYTLIPVVNQDFIIEDILTLKDVFADEFR